MSPRAAWRLERLGFGEVYDYVAGKLEWLAQGLPIEGSKADEPRAGSVARRDAPTCGLDDRVGDVRAMVGNDGICVVTNDAGIVAGVLRAEQLAGDDNERAEDVMRPGPSTFRPHVPIDEMAHYMTEHDLPNAPITSADGKLIGVLYRTDAVHTAHGKAEG